MRNVLVVLAKVQRGRARSRAVHLRAMRCKQVVNVASSIACLAQAPPVEVALQLPLPLGHQRLPQAAP
eukprot:4343902-Pyramimonas_sp.AAC.1